MREAATASRLIRFTKIYPPHTALVLRANHFDATISAYEQAII